MPPDAPSARMGGRQEGRLRPVLYLTRKVGESVIINDSITVEVVEIRGKSIKLGFEFPPDVTVLRQELHQRIQEENRAAAEGDNSDALTELLGPNDSGPRR